MRLRTKPPGLVALLLAGHPLIALATAAGVTLAAAAFGGRDAFELGLVLATVSVGQWTINAMNDIADRERDRQAGREDKPLAQGWISPSSVAWGVAYATCLLVPLAMTNGTQAGAAYLVSVLIGWLGTRVLRRSPLSFVPIALSYALLPSFLSYGGSGGGMQGDPATIDITVVAALLGIGVHFFSALPDLVADNNTGMTSLPLRVAKRIGAPRLLWLTVVYLAVVVAALVYVGSTAGLRAP